MPEGRLTKVRVAKGRQMANMCGPESVGYVECGVGEAVQVSEAEVEPGENCLHKVDFPSII